TGRPLRPGAGRSAGLAADGRPQPRDRPSARARDGAGGHGIVRCRGSARDHGAGSRRRRLRGRAPRARRARARAARPGGASRDRAGVLPGPQPQRNREHARTATRHGQDAHPEWHDPDARRARRRGKGIPVTHATPTARERTRAALYAIGALEPAEADEYRRHLTGCAACTAEVAGFAAVTESLLVAPPSIMPRPALRDSVLASIEAERVPTFH